MICECCRRDVDHVRSSFWHGEARICRECLAQWCDGDNDEISADAASVGNYVRLKHGLPPLAAALALLLLIAAPTAYASRHCLDYPEAATTWPSHALVKDGDGCWTYDHHPPRAEVPAMVEMAPVLGSTGSVTGVPEATVPFRRKWSLSSTVMKKVAVWVVGSSSASRAAYPVFPWMVTCWPLAMSSVEPVISMAV